MVSKVAEPPSDLSQVETHRIVEEEKDIKFRVSHGTESDGG